MDIVPLIRLAAEATDLQYLFKFECHSGRLYYDTCAEETEEMLKEFFDPRQNRQGLVRAANLFKEIKVLGSLADTSLSNASIFILSIKLHAADAKL